MPLRLAKALVRRHQMTLERTRLTGELLGLARRWKRRPRPYVGPDMRYFDAARNMFVFRGTPREIGQQFAASLPVTTMLAHYGTVRAHEPAEPVRRLTAMLERCAPDYAAFLRGIADRSAPYDVATVIRLACCSVLDAAPPPRSCTSLACRPSGRPIVAQNLDLGADTLVSLVCLNPTEGEARLALVNVGYPWLTTIVNGAGVVAAGSSVNVSDEPRPDVEQLPQELLFDVLLSRARSADAAVTQLESLPPIGPFNGGVSAVIADTTGTIHELEVTGGALRVQRNAACAVTSNHFCHEDLQSLNRRDNWFGARLEANSVARRAHGVRVATSGAVTRDVARELLRTPGGDGAWLRQSRWPDSGYTTASYLVDLDRGDIEVWLGADARTSTRLALADCLDRPVA